MKNFKKLLSAVVLGSAVAMSCLAFAGCGDDEDGGKPNADVNAQYHEGNVQDELPDMSKVVSEKVADETAWEAAFNYDGCKNVSAYMNEERLVGDKVENAMSQWAKLTDGASYRYGKMVEKSVSLNGEGYCTGSGNDTHALIFDGNDGLWHKYPAKVYNSLDDFVRGAGVPFAQVKYENGAYCYSTGETGNTMEYVCKIVDKKVAYVKKLRTRTQEGTTQEQISEVYFYNIGKTSVALPTKTKDGVSISEEKGEQVTSEQWESAMAQTAFGNCAINLVESGYSSSNEILYRASNPMQLDIANGVYKEIYIGNSNIPYYGISTDAAHGGKTYVSDDNKKWIDQGGESHFDYYVTNAYERYITPYLGHYGEFTFDAEKGEYVATNVTLRTEGDDYITEKSYAKISAKFKDGKLVKASITEKSIRNDVEISEESICYISDYGAVKITVPQV